MFSVSTLWAYTLGTKTSMYPGELCRDHYVLFRRHRKKIASLNTDYFCKISAGSNATELLASPDTLVQTFECTHTAHTLLQHE